MAVWDTGLVPARVRTPAGELKHAGVHLVYAASPPPDIGVQIDWQPAVCGYRPSKTSTWVHSPDEKHLCRYCRQWQKENT